MIITLLNKIKKIINESKTLVNIFFTFGARILKALTIFVLMILVARKFGPEGKGIITMALFLPDFLYFMMHLGLGNASIFFISNSNEDEKTIYNNSVWQGLGLSILAITIVLVLRLVNPNVLGIGFPTSLLYIALAIVPFSFLETFFENLFAGKQEFRIFNGIIILDRIALIVVMLVAFLKYNISLNFVLSLIFINLILQVTTYFVLLVRRYGLPNIFKFNTGYFKKAIDFGFRSYLACFLCYLVLRSDLYMLSVMKGVKDVGLYSVATNFIDAMLLLSGSASAVIFPLINRNISRAGYYIKRFTSLISLASCGIILLTLVFGRPFISLFFGLEFVSASMPLYILLIAMYFWSLLSILTQFFAAKNYPWKAVYIWIPGIVLNIVINWIWIPRYGMLAAAWSSVIAYALTFFLHFWLIQKYERIKLKELIFPWIIKTNHEQI